MTGPAGGSDGTARKGVQNFEFVGKSLLAGAVAGAFAKTIVAPMDRVKILFQGHNRSFSAERGTFRGVVTATQRIAVTEGLRGLWKGHSAMLLRIAPYSAINYMCFEQYKRILIPAGGRGDGHERKKSDHHLERLLAGSLAGATSVVFTYPLDVTRARLAFQVKTQKYSGIFDVWKRMVLEEGRLSLFRGFTPTLLGILPYAGTSFYTNDMLRLMVLDARIPFTYVFDANQGKNRLNAVTQLAIGAVAGAAAQTVSYPLDVVRRRMQLHGMAYNSPAYRHTLDVFAQVVRTEGARGLFVGLSINYLKVVPATAVSFLTYEYLKREFGIAGRGAE